MTAKGGRVWGHKESEGRTGRLVGNNFPSHQVPGLNAFSKSIKGNSQGLVEKGNQHLPRLFNKGVIMLTITLIQQQTLTLHHSLNIDHKLIWWSLLFYFVKK